MYEIAGKIALITGGASGIGLFCAKELLKNGLKGVTLADVNEEHGKKALEEIEKEFGEHRVIFVKTDVTNKLQFEEAFKATVQNFKHVDILINNAGIFNDVIWEQMILINMNGTINGTLLGLDNYIPKYRTGSEGVIVNVASIAGIDPFGCVPIYTGTKHAVIGLSRSFGTELHYNKTKVKILTMCPGVTDTPMVDFSKPSEKILGPRYIEMMQPEIGSLKPQPVKYVAKAMVEIIKRGKSGSVWVAEDKQPPHEVNLQSREQIKKL